MKPVTDPGLLSQLEAGQKPVTDPALLDQLSQQPGIAEDMLKSAGSGLVKGITHIPGIYGDLQQIGSAARTFLENKFGAPGGKAVKWLEEQSKPYQKYAERGDTMFMPPMPTSGDVQGVIEQKTGKLYEPQTTPGHYAQTVTEMAPSALMGAGGLGQRAVMNALVPGVASETAGHLTKGTAWEPWARAGAAVTAPYAAGKLVNAARTPIVELPNSQQLKDAGGVGFEEFRNSGLVLKSGGSAGSTALAPAGVTTPSEGVKAVGEKMRSALEDMGLDSSLAGKTFERVAKLENPPANSVLTAANLHSIRQNLGKIGEEVNPLTGKPTQDAAAASVAKRILDDYISSPPAADIITNAPGAVDTFKKALGNYSAGSRSGMLDRKLEQAEVRSDVANSGQNYANTARARVADIYLSPKQHSGWNPDELAQAKKVTEGTVPGNLARIAGNMLGGGGGLGALASSAAGAGAGSMLGGPFGAAAGATAPAFGLALKKLSQASNNRQIDLLDQMIRSRSPLAQELLATIPNQITDTSPAALARILLSQQPRQQ
jgi:hypothetical protein